jgi:hypothetical protein
VNIKIRSTSIFLICLLFIFSFIGCQKITDETSLQSAIEADTNSILDQHPTWVTEAIFISGLGISAIEDNANIQASVLKSQIVNEIVAGSLSPGDKVLATVFVDKLTVYLDEYFKYNGITDNAEQIKVIRKALDWVNGIAVSKLQSISMLIYRNRY